MRRAISKGVGFGLTSGVITTLGLIIGLNSSTHSKAVVISGILIIAVADSFSDAFGIHISEESDGRSVNREIWLATLTTLIMKAVTALSFAVPIALVSLEIAIPISIIWGLFLILVFSFFVAKQRKTKPKQVIMEHLLIAMAVIIISNVVGDWIGRAF